MFGGKENRNPSNDNVTLPIIKVDRFMVRITYFTSELNTQASWTRFSSFPSRAIYYISHIIEKNVKLLILYTI